MKTFCDGGGIDEVALTDLTRNVAVDALQLDLPLHGDDGSVCLRVDSAFQFRFEATSTPGPFTKVVCLLILPCLLPRNYNICDEFSFATVEHRCSTTQLI